MKSSRALCLLLFVSPVFLLGQQISYLEVEAKFNPRLGRMAGTLRAHLHNGSPQGEWHLPEGLAVDKVLINEEQVPFRRGNSGFSIANPEPNSRVQRIQVVFFGTPPPQASRFYEDQNRQSWILLDDREERWHPWPPSGWALPDSVWTAFILPEGMRPVTRARFDGAGEWPGGFQRWVHQYSPEQLSEPIYLGNYVRFAELRQAPGGIEEWPFWVPQAKLEQAQVTYAQVPVMINALAAEWGEPAFSPADNIWVEWPGEWVMGPPGGNPETLVTQSLMMKVAEMWVGPRYLAHESPIRSGMFQYADWVWRQHEQGEAEAETILEIARQRPSGWPFWLMYDLVHSYPGIWQDEQVDFFRLVKDQTVSDKDLRRWIARRIDADRMVVFEQYLDEQEKPLLACELDRRRRKWVLSYRWVGALPDFVWPVEIEFGDERLVVIPTRKKQEISWPRRQGRSYMIDEAQGLFDIRSR